MNHTDRLVRCQECGAPWGVVKPSNVVEAARRLRTELFAGQDFLVVGRLPVTRRTEVVFVSEASARFLDDIGAWEPWCEGDTYMELTDEPPPEWWCRGRIMPAIRWDCCSIKRMARAS